MFICWLACMFVCFIIYQSQFFIPNNRHSRNVFFFFFFFLLRQCGSCIQMSCRFTFLLLLLPLLLLFIHWIKFYMNKFCELSKSFSSNHTSCCSFHLSLSLFFHHLYRSITSVVFHFASHARLNYFQAI